MENIVEAILLLPTNFICIHVCAHALHVVQTIVGIRRKTFFKYKRLKRFMLHEFIFTLNTEVKKQHEWTCERQQASKR